ncbi:Nucleotide-binding alpha-beta plait domain protein [Raphanus sativus]|nr:Nucleotide-binding alpha-beta plait domain protein [Raphanus sativus]
MHLRLAREKLPVDIPTNSTCQIRRLLVRFFSRKKLRFRPRRSISTIFTMTSVKVSNVSLGATERDLKEFFSFSGDILYLETTARQKGLSWHMSLSRIYKELKLLFFSREQRLLILQSLSLWLLITNYPLRL